MSKETYNLDDLVEDAVEVLSNLYQEDPDIDLEDSIPEVVDGVTPIYYWDIAQYAAHNHGLMTFKPGLYTEGMTACDQIKANIYEHILDGLFQHKEGDEDD